MAKQKRKQQGQEHNGNACFPAIDNDLAVENLTNDFDMTGADLQDIRGGNRHGK